jgi:ferritin-like metal-binding protein YciE
MRFRIIMTAAVLGLVLSACGGDTHESVAEDQLDLMDEIFDIMDGVTDEASAKEAAKKIEALGEDMADLRKRIAAMPDPTKEEEKRLEAMFTERQADIMKRSQNFGAKMMKYPELAQAFSKAGQAMGK